MKRIFVFTLTALFAITCLFLTDLPAWGNYEDWDDGYADMPFEDVYGYVYVTVWYEPGVFTAYSSHHFFLNNGVHLPVNYSYYFSSGVTGPADIDPQNSGDAGQVANDEVLDSDQFSYDMAGEEGVFTISGNSDLYIDADFDHNNMPDAWDQWNASAFILFEI